MLNVNKKFYENAEKSSLCPISTLVRRGCAQCALHITKYAPKNYITVHCPLDLTQRLSTPVNTLITLV